MKKTLIATLALLVLVSGCTQQSPSEPNKTSSPTTQKPFPTSEIKNISLKLTSPAFLDGGPIPQKYTCDGEDFSPPINITGVPENTKSLALIVDDPDALGPAGKIWTHWILWNINPLLQEINENSVPGVQGVNDFGLKKYRGPCPPDKEHRYLFHLYALDTELNLPEGSKKSDLEKAMEGHVLQEKVLTAVYKRTK